VVATRQPQRGRRAGSLPRRRNRCYFAAAGFGSPLAGRSVGAFFPWTGFFVVWSLLAPLVMTLLLVASDAMDPLRYRNVKSVDA